MELLFALTAVRNYKTIPHFPQSHLKSTQTSHAHARLHLLWLC
jgi:hypothetical protein